MLSLLKNIILTSTPCLPCKLLVATYNTGPISVFPWIHPFGCDAASSLGRCEGGVDVVGVVTLLVRGVAQVLHGDQVVELSVQLEVQEVEGKEEDREGQVEVEEERGELKEKRTCTWMTSDETQT